MKFEFVNVDEKTKEIKALSEDILSEALASGGVKVNTKFVADLSGDLKIEKGDNEVTVSYKTVPGLCRALTYLAGKDYAELNEVHEETCPFRDFGIMNDMSRNAVLNIETSKKLIRTMAFMGYDFYGLYMEDTMEIIDEPYIGYMRGSMTSADIKELDEYAKKFGVELVPYVQTLAHLNQIFQYNEYKKINDTEDILLVGEERTYTLIDNILKTVSENFTTKKVHIGMDEAHMVGLGKYYDRHGAEDRFQILENHLKRVLEICKKYDLQPQIWSDMYFRLAFNGSYYVDGRPEEIAPVNIPSEVTLVYWDYYSQDETHYDDMFCNHKKLTNNIAFAGGAWKWMGFAPNNTFSIKATNEALKASIKNDIQSFTMTAWGDDGAECSIFAIMPTLFEAADLAYNSDMDKKSFEFLTQMSFDEYMCLDYVNPYVRVTGRKNTACKSLLFDDLLQGKLESLVREDTAAQFEMTAKELAALTDKEKYGYIFDTGKKLCDCLALKCDMSKRIYNAYNAGDKAALSQLADVDLPKLTTLLEDFYEAFEKQWYTENRPEGFEIQTARIAGQIQRSRDVQKRIKKYLAGEISEIHELTGKRLPFSNNRDKGLEDLYLNRWLYNASCSVV